MYDLIVVGGGVLGAFHAFHASRLGKRVLLLEKDPRQKGSSTQNFGQVVPSGLSKKWNAFGQRSLKIYQELMQQGDFTLKQGGSLYVASDEDELMLLEELSEKHLQAGYTCISLTKKGVLERFPDLNESYVKGGLFYPQEMSVNPLEFVHRFTNYLAEKNLVTVKYGQSVVSATETSAQCQVETETGQSFTAEKIIICCGYTFNLLYPDVFKTSGIIISKLQMMITEPQPEVNFQANILTGLTIRRYESFTECASFSAIKTPERLLPYKEAGIHILFKQENDGSIIIGDSHEYGHFNQREEMGEHSRADFDELILGEAGRIVNFKIAPIARKWAGFYGQHPDDIFVYQADKNIRIITGIGGKGMTSSAGFAEQSIQNLYEL